MAASAYGFNLNGEHAAALLRAGAAAQVRVTQVEQASHGLTVGEVVCGLRGHGTDRPFEDQLVLLYSLTGTQLDTFVDRMRAGGYHGFFAVVTKDNRKWKMPDLVAELRAEKEMYEARRKGKQA